MQFSIIHTSKLDSIVFRLDAEYYHPKHIALENKLKTISLISIRDAEGSIDCSAFYPSIVPYYNFEKVGIPFLRVNEIQNGLLHLTQDTAFLPKEILDENNSTIAKCQAGDLIIAKGGNSLAKVALITEDYKAYSICRDVIVLQTQELVKINKYYLWMFLHSKIGQQLLLRTASQTGQPHLTVEALYQLEIPLFSSRFQNNFEWLYNQAQDIKKKSENIYIQAQTLLLSELGLLDWKPKHQLSFVKNFSDTQNAGRFDAEYFQPKYEEIVKAIKGYKGGWDILENLCELVGHPSNPPYADTEDKDKTFIVTQKHLGDFSLNDEFWKDEVALYTTQEFLHKNTQYILQQGDVLLYSVGAYIGKANIYTENIKATIGSFLTLIRTKGEILNPFYLMSFLNTDIGIAISKQHQRGMAQQYLYPYDIRNFPIPLLAKEIQNQIQKKITESFKLRKQSKQLLEAAKTAVEMAIEKSEKEAEEWLKNEMKGIGVNVK